MNRIRIAKHQPFAGKNVPKRELWESLPADHQEFVREMADAGLTITTIQYGEKRYGEGIKLASSRSL